jgi:hypothetical protein
MRQTERASRDLDARLVESGSLVGVERSAAHGAESTHATGSGKAFTSERNVSHFNCDAPVWRILHLNRAAVSDFDRKTRNAGSARH